MLLVVAVVVAVAAWLAVIVLTPHPPSPASITHAMRAQAALSGGQKVYVTHCAACHDKGFGPSLAGQDIAPEVMQTMVRTGPAMMPAFPPSQVSDADIVAAAAYLNHLPAQAAAK